ncbi:glycerate kinase [Anaerotignum lactatifermentans]|uniref:Glycerate kinase n=2 Tax=Anaerotignum lactatifermentans TaxID=160404 RepID=A0ABS2GDK0_9FIRM|nr:glycerate kinase [Anaerotignum lactatifermentans]MBM6828692.1 glycerate kinase [Anaerotignum lactatifermentans]MBM6878785.1 glycerate kinase [Anaerotignum lactatifermentans]MBM6950274.1 glycerate kinase [Anaerotignum lactatifermentans]
MNSPLRQDALHIIEQTLQKVLPETAVHRALEGRTFPGRILVVSIGKAAWTMAKAAAEVLPRLDGGIVLTKYGHSQGPIPGFSIREAGHPVTDENSLLGAEEVLRLVEQTTPEDTVLLLLSGGGSALFEKPAQGLTLAQLQDVSRQLLACGANIVEINTIRKHLSAVKGGRFGALCAPASVFVIALSDILGDRLDSIASGPASPDQSTSEEALAIVRKYGLVFPPAVMEQLKKETPKTLPNASAVITGSVSQLCHFAAEEAQKLGYTPLVLTSQLDCEAREAGRFFGAMAQSLEKGGSLSPRPTAILCGGETVVRLTGTGKGGRNQELALAAAPYMDGLPHVLVAAVGSDGTDGPTDAAGGITDGSTMAKLRQAEIDLDEILADNNAYEALKQADGLIMTGPTGTNVNDLYFLLFRPKE